MGELKPCPFCGKHNLWTYSSTYAPEGLRFVKCAQNPEEDDGCVGGVSVDTWNKRPIEDALTATIAQKDVAIQELTGALMEIYCLPHNASIEQAVQCVLEMQEIARKNLEVSHE